MYHHFTSRNSPSQETITHKLKQILKHYEQLQSLKPKNQFVNILTGSITKDQFRVNINRSLHNLKHKCIIFCLSNSKLVRYDFEDEVFEEIDGLDDIDLMGIQVLQIGETQRYLVVGQDGIGIFSLIREKLERKPKSQQMEKNKVKENWSQRMQQESSQLSIDEKPCFEYNFSIKKIKCRIFFQGQNQIITQGQESKIQVNQMKQRRVKSAKALIIKDLGLLEKYQSQESNLKKEGKLSDDENERVLVLFYFMMAGNIHMNLVVYELTLRRQNQQRIHMKELSNQFTRFQQGLNGQILQISQVQFPNNKHFIQLALCFIQIPFDPQKQSQDINPIEVTEFLRKFTPSNLLLECDLNFIIQEKSQVAMFSFYITNRAITHQMEPLEYRNYVFEFRLAINVKECQVVYKQMMWGSPFYQYPQRKVMCPAKVYCLPIVPNTTVLNYINVTKTLSFTTTKTLRWQPLSYKFTTVTMLQDNRLQFTQIQHIINEDQDGTIKRSYRNILNQEHKKWNVRVGENIVFGEIILVDLIKLYAVILVREGKVQIRNQLILRGQFILKIVKRNESKIVVINLRQNLEPNYKKVCSQFSLGDSHDHIQPYIYLGIDSMQGNNLLVGQELSIQTHPSVLNNSLHHNKSLSLIYYQLNKNERYIYKKEFLIFERIDMVPKTVIYCDMLCKLFDKMHQKNSKAQNTTIEENQDRKDIHNTNGMDTFFATIIDLLEP